VAALFARTSMAKALVVQRNAEQALPLITADDVVCLDEHRWIRHNAEGHWDEHE
jgi:hypothetical protein